MTLSPLAQRSPFGGRFEVEREVGRGGVGIVYRAFDRETELWVALKLIAVQGVDASEEARFLREGKLLQELDHPHIVRLVACGTLEDTPYVAMEWLEGEDLAARNKRAAFGLRDALEVARQIAVALEAAHNAGIIHRDIKPSNIFLVNDPSSDKPFAKLVDFGVALEDDVRLTRTGVVVGTPAYMAPEQAKADGQLDARADIYSLGASLFELVAGRPPHVGPTAIATLARLVTTDAPRLSELVPLVPAPLDHLVFAMLATDPARRPTSARHVADTLAALTGDASTTDVTLPRSGPSVQTTAAVQGTRLFTSIVGLRMGGGEGRAKIVEQLRHRGADAVALGQDAVVAHLGARRSLGGEAPRALELGRFLAEKGGKVGVATGRSKVDLTRPVGEVVDRAAGLAHSADPSQVLADTTTTE
ncbi:MAG TPA: serine/threonine-protein kinase, partial [Polyangiaceae bacterium]|nr:serine/threonine-protein kinase [Polyangiaceae bacterium]